MQVTTMFRLIVHQPPATCIFQLFSHVAKQRLYIYIPCSITAFLGDYAAGACYVDITSIKFWSCTLIRIYTCILLLGRVKSTASDN